MATTQLEKVRLEAMKLSDIERAQLAHDLVKSLDAPEESGVADAWDRELESRLDQVHAGTAVVIDRDEFRRRMERKLSGQ
jgi:putative addiction module component (TIGR02574 family)